jgi:hypothetical protein
MSYIGVSPSTAAFPFDQFSGNGTTTAFTMSYAPASTTSMVVCISGVVQNPNTYGISGLTLTFSTAPPTGTNNIAVLYLGIPATSVTTPGNSAYLSSTEFTATAGQTTFTPSGSYQVGFVNVIRNGAQLAPSDYTATNGTTVVLGSACAVGDAVVIEVYNLVSVANALPSTGGTVTGATTFNSTVSINGANGSGYTGYKNRIINGGMVIDQRNNGASVTIASGQFYTVDRWGAFSTQASKYSAQQNAGSVTPPSGFKNYLGFTSLAATTVTATDYFMVTQPIEGLNIADLNWGTASAATVTLSFWVRSSLTGTFGGALTNSGSTRSYPFSYTISAANTWEQKSITIAGDTSGTWLTTNSVGIQVILGFGVGTTYSGTAGAWSGSSLFSATGATSVVGTNGATFYVTGVQLERGSNATSFEFRDYGRELMMCQRYYQILQNTSGGRAETATLLNLPFRTICTMRATPSGATVGTIVVRDISGTTTRTANTPGSPSLAIINDTGGYLEINASSYSPANFSVGALVALVCSVGINGIALSAEL